MKNNQAYDSVRPWGKYIVIDNNKKYKIKEGIFYLFRLNFYSLKILYV